MEKKRKNDITPFNHPKKEVQNKLQFKRIEVLVKFSNIF